jgi:membrane-bound lytic murein transglycosylase F
MNFGFKGLSKKLLSSMVWAGILFSVNGCESWWLEKSGSKTDAPQELRLAVINQPFTYQEIYQVKLGYEYELLQNFAQEAGYKIKVTVFNNQQEVIQAVEKGTADIGAARLPAYVIRSSATLAGPAYDEDKLSLICHKKQKVDFNFIGNLSHTNSFRLVTSSKFVDPGLSERMKRIAPHLQIKTQTAASAVQIFREIKSRRQDCTVMDRLEAKYYLRFFPELKVLKDIPQSRVYSFAINRDQSGLERQMRIWMTKAARKQFLTLTKKIAKLNIEELHQLDVAKFMRAKNHVLPMYQAWFRKHGKEFDIPWQLAAAVAYQESGWNPDAKSFTGVRGFMQLTQETAEHLGVEDRMDPEQSIWGGVKYLKILLDRQPHDIPWNDRMSLALATYNVGPAHMQDAQALAVRLGKNPYSWQDLQTVLPLLSESSYLEYFKYGKARGQEPVDFVHRVFAYLDLMSAKI